MGNIIGSVDEEFNSLRHTHLKARGATNTALGKYSTPNLNKRSVNNLPIISVGKNKANEFNSKIYKEIFPPPDMKRFSRNTIAPIYFSSNSNTNSISNSEIVNKLNNSENEEKVSLDGKILCIGQLGNQIEIEENKEKNENYENFAKKPIVDEVKKKNFVDKNIFTNLNTNNNILDTIEIDVENNIEKKENNELVSNKTERTEMTDESDNLFRGTKSVITNYEYELQFFKTGEDIRRSYIAKLIYKKIWQPTVKEKDHNTLIIFDWDDTLLCTSFLTPNGVFLEDTKIPERDLEKIKKLEMSSANILKQAISKGETYIITNAAPGWVEYSANRFYPEVAKLLKKVTIVSARGEYEKKFPGDSRQWKILAFLETLNNLDSNLVTNLICLGDSVIEMEAAHILASKFQQAYIKTIKFREAPKPEELNKQLGLVVDQFEKIFSAVKNLTIRVEKKSKDESNLLSNSNSKNQK